jgi:hypothetical protein
MEPNIDDLVLVIGKQTMAIEYQAKLISTLNAQIKDLTKPQEVPVDAKGLATQETANTGSADASQGKPA